MLNIAKLGVGTAHKYFQEEFAAASSSYLTENGKTVGVWHGKLAEQLGLTGAVEEEAYHRLVDGQHPHTGEQLVRHRETYLTREGKEAAHVPAWDFTLSVPKTWSLAAIVGQDDRLIRAAEIANEKALQAAENYVQARGGGSAPPITARQWAVATFRHDTSRPVDGYPAPQLHFHNVAFNLVLETQTNPAGKFRLFIRPRCIASAPSLPRRSVMSSCARDARWATRCISIQRRARPR
jgi:conjugative relaxase-like TrwC/TraI family protein